MLQPLATKSLMGRLDTGETGITNAGTCDTQYFDVQGYDYASIDVLLGTSNNTTNKPSVFNLEECDTTVSSSFASVTGFVAGTDWTVPAMITATSNGNNIIRFDVDCRARKRYLRLKISPVTTQEMAYNIRLGRASESPTTTTQAGVLAYVRG